MEKVSDQNKNIPILVDKLDHLKYKTDILSTSHKSMKNEMENISTNLTAYRTVVKKTTISNKMHLLNLPYCLSCNHPKLSLPEPSEANSIGRLRKEDEEVRKIFNHLGKRE